MRTFFSVSLAVAVVSAQQTFEDLKMEETPHSVYGGSFVDQYSHD